MTKKRSRIIAAGMLLAAIVFLAYVAGHPEASFPWGNSVTVNFYRIYIAVMVYLFIAPFKHAQT